MFGATDARFTREFIWALPYDSKFKPDNPLIKLFSPIGGDYLVKPSQEIIENWNNQVQRPVAVAGALTGIPYDARGPLSVRTIAGQPAVTKFISQYINIATGLPTNPLTKNGRWNLFRQAQLHLRFAEAANRDGFPRLASALISNGLPVEYDIPAQADKTTIMNTFMYPDPYKFDARNGNIPNYRSAWYRNIGIRSRVNLPNYPLTANNIADSITQMEVGLINEQALETAFEGTRWADLLRVAIRRNDPSFIAKKVGDKLRKDGTGDPGAAESKLTGRNWYLPFKMQ